MIPLSRSAEDGVASSLAPLPQPSYPGLTPLEDGSAYVLGKEALGRQLTGQSVSIYEIFLTSLVCFFDQINFITIVRTDLGLS